VHTLSSCFVYEEWMDVCSERTLQCYLPCSIYPSQQEPGTVQIPIGNNTGSLPDLTSFHFPSPLPTPLDQEDPSSSPYSTVSVALLSVLSYFIKRHKLIFYHFFVVFVIWIKGLYNVHVVRFLWMPTLMPTSKYCDESNVFHVRAPYYTKNIKHQQMHKEFFRQL
jgi:hypothetical protein